MLHGGERVIGFLASQTDMLSNDWYQLKPEIAVDEQNIKILEKEIRDKDLRIQRLEQICKMYEDEMMNTLGHFTSAREDSAYYYLICVKQRCTMHSKIILGC